MANSTTVKIDGAKLKELLESATGKSLYEIALDNGFSRNTLKNAVKNNYASATIQALARLYGIEPEEYKLKEETHKSNREQITIDDIQALRREDLKTILKEVMTDIVYNSEIVVIDDARRGKRLLMQERKEV